MLFTVARLYKSGFRICIKLNPRLNAKDDVYVFAMAMAEDSQHMPPEFNWINARVACSPARIFNDLFLAIKGDVGERNVSLQARDASPLRPSFDLGMNSSGQYFAVFRVGDVRSTIEFFLRTERIEVKTSAESSSITLSLDNQGVCKLRMNGGELLEQWQVRKILLEGLFFG